MSGIFGLHRGRTVAIVDAGSGYVGCAIVTIAPTGRTHVLGHAYSKLSLEKRTPEQASARIAEEIAEATDAALVNAHVHTKGIHVSHVFGILHAPWLRSLVFKGSSAFDHEVTIHDSHIAQLAQDSLAKQKGISASNTFETNVLSIQINGYETTVPDGKRGRSLAIASIVSTFEGTLKPNAEGALHKAFPAAELSWHSSAKVYASILSDLELPSDALVVSVGAQTTEVTRIEGGVPVIENVVDEGVGSILARVHDERPPEETLGLLRMLARDACANDACVAIQKAVALAEPELVKIFGESFAAMIERERLPSTLVLIAHEDIAPWLTTFFERIDFTQFTTTALPFNVRQIDLAHLTTRIENEHDVHGTLAVAVAYIATQKQST